MSRKFLTPIETPGPTYLTFGPSAPFATGFSTGSVMTSQYAVMVPRWHNLLQWGAYVPVSEQWNGTAWVAGPATPLYFFDSNGINGQNICDATYSAWRCTWNGLVATYVMQMIFSFAWTSANPTRDIVIEKSIDGTAWVTMNTITGVTWNTFPYNVSLGSGGFNDVSYTYLRVTVTRTAPSGDINLVELQGLTPRWGSQGKGPEAERAYTVDYYRGVSFQSINAGGSSLRALGAAGQTANIFEIRNSANTLMLQASNVGGLTAGMNNASQFPIALTAAESAHTTSRRAAVQIGSPWLLMSDKLGTGVKDFAIYNAAAGKFPLQISADSLSVHIGNDTGLTTYAQKVMVAGNPTAALELAPKQYVDTFNEVYVGPTDPGLGGPYELWIDTST